MLQGFVINLGKCSSKWQDVFESLHDQDLTFTDENSSRNHNEMSFCCFKTV